VVAVHEIAYGLAEVISKPSPPPPGGFVDSLPEAFGAVDGNGEVFVIGYKGEWYHVLKPSLRVRLHNWLINFGNRRNPE
jgi:hypothetical protein